MTQLSRQLQLCIRDCQECDRACSMCLAHCLERGGRHADGPHIRLLIDCAALCHLSADYIARGSAYHRRLCSLCEEVCTACAESCDPFVEDVVLADCAAQCRRCADTLAGMNAD